MAKPKKVSKERGRASKKQTQVRDLSPRDNVARTTKGGAVDAFKSRPVPAP
jgi:hypothetical protein